MRNKREILFIHLSCALTILHALGYVWLGFTEGFSVCIYAMIVLDLLFIPATLINNSVVFPAYLVVFSVGLVFITAFIQSELFNNYSALLCIFIAILIFPKLKNFFMGIYLVTAAIAFCVAHDPVYYLVIHFARALWLFTVHNFIIYSKYERKPVILFEEEIEILEQLTDNKLQKEIELNGLSERTIRRRLDTAKRRNGLKSTDELKELYIKTYKRK